MRNTTSSSSNQRSTKIVYNEEKELFPRKCIPIACGNIGDSVTRRSHAFGRHPTGPLPFDPFSQGRRHGRALRHRRSLTPPRGGHQGDEDRAGTVPQLANRARSPPSLSTRDEGDCDVGPSPYSHAA